MCLTFYTKTGNPYSAVLTAKKDITVYKVVELRPDNTYRSQYVSFKYNLGQHYKSGENWPEGICYTQEPLIGGDVYRHMIFFGFHSYDTLPFAQIKLEQSWDDSIQTYIVECRIPKGAKYIEGDNHDIISDQIIVNRQL